MRGNFTLSIAVFGIGCGRPARPTTVEDDTWQATQALGPFASREDFCDHLARRGKMPEPDYAEGQTWCEPEKLGKDAQGEPSTALYQTEVTVAGWQNDFSGVRYDMLLVTLHTAAGWWFAPLVEQDDPGTGDKSWEVALDSVAEQDLGGSRAVVVRGRAVEGECDCSLEVCYTVDHEHLVVCGVGPSGKPSCTPSLALSRLRHDWACPEVEDEGNEDAEFLEKSPTKGAGWRYAVSFPGDGVIVVSVDGEKTGADDEADGPPPETLAAVGKRRLVFP